MEAVIAQIGIQSEIHLLSLEKLKSVLALVLDTSLEAYKTGVLPLQWIEPFTMDLVTVLTSWKSYLVKMPSQ